MNSLINFRLSFVLLSSVLILLLSCSKDKDTIDQKSNKTDIKSWKFGNKVANISGTDITITLASGTDITALTADVQLSSGASISPDPTKSIDYTNSVKFTVTAEDGNTTKDYTVTVNVTNNANIKSWKFGDKLANISGTDITITLSYGTDITALTADVQLSPGATISPDPTQSKNYTNPVTFTVTSEDGNTTKDYQVKVNVAKNDKAEIKSWKFGDKSANISGTDITIDLVYGTDITTLEADIELSIGATISPDPSNGIDYTNPVTFTVTAEDGNTTKDYQVKVNVAKNDKAEIKSWKFGNKVATISRADITITLSSAIDITALTADVQLSSGASISPDPTKSIDYTNPVTFTVTSEDGNTTNNYKVTISVELIISWTAGWRDDDAYTATINQSTGKIDIDVNSADFDTKVSLSAGVTISPDPNSVTDWTNEVTFTTTKGLKTKTYKVKVKVNGKDIIKVNDLNQLKAKINTEIAKPNGNTANYNYIDVSSVTDMKELFKNKKQFNGDISKWYVSNVTNMFAMFEEARAFNQNIDSWNVSKVTNMGYMFFNAKVFNKNISSWTVSQVNECRLFSKFAEALQIGNIPTFNSCSE